MKQTNDLYKYLSITNRFAGAHNFPMPRDVVEEIIAKTDPHGKLILVIYNVEFVVSLVNTFNVDPKNIIFCSDHENKTKLVNRLGVDAITTIDDTSRFDTVLMNPPYTRGQVMLYTKYFKQALSISETVVCVMPLDLESRHDKLKFHNQRVLEHASFISDNISDRLKGPYTNLHYVIASNSTHNKVEEIADPLDSMPLLFPKRARLAPIKGDTNTAIGAEVPDGVETVYKVHKKDTVLYKKVAPSKVDKSKKKSKAKYLVFVNHTPSRGRFNCVVLPNTGQTWSMWTFAFECKTKAEGAKLKEWLQGPTIVGEIKKMLEARNNQHTISKAMIERLPTYA